MRLVPLEIPIRNLRKQELKLLGLVVTTLHLTRMRTLGWSISLSNSSVEAIPGTQWLHRRVEVDGYEEYSEVEYSPAGCTGEYIVIE
ncbi:hypothetical protein Syun_012689 [Stephania yunnanensis]|uniref:Uncharacterized protein n=1 Tax=Stephania yunnanensis TaxID=152371 RepID=A0AAP0PHT3_9MAGN